LSTLLCAALAAGCAAAPSLTEPATILGHTELELDAGTYMWVLDRPGIEFPPIRFTVPDGWGSGGRFTYRIRPGIGETPVAMQFWDVGKLYGHPCKWRGTLFDPGPTVDDLAAAIVDIPLRDAIQPSDVTLGGYSGKYLEWSVPADIDFSDCDMDGGEHFFESWIGDPTGWDGDRYHQGPGQVDRLWILDIDGVRFVIDAFSMPSATDPERAELVKVVESIGFVR
jgi:hypothetical protein